MWNSGLGVPKQEKFIDFFNCLNQVQPLTVFAAAFTFFVMLKGEKIISKIPESILSIASGTALYYLIRIFRFGSQLGPVIGSIPSGFPSPQYIIKFYGLFSDGTFFSVLSILVSAAFSMAVLGSIDSLINSVTIQNLSNQRADSNRELIGQGIGNMMASIFGVTPEGGYLSRSIVSYQSC